ncbi:Zn(II)2Cys6 transcription factor domain-containing protein [Aspergillus puulaauensis]|uniref:Zn(2)-C6 fungal-type domain-containing protein n=1 Tax=Aspergillus puulaauensis TaxID=1220207 RepID=A0A7R8AQC5_9EURO|nr:uncharacterized protein APUU_60299A [Aspergillus puulaauensis]BCS27251.1 hypothetical protein APUU_60299A [Aspergillus puulaauensis]
MPAKRKTGKSHHGCSECKRRSVKCDEKRPQCSSCENRRTACHYATSGPFFWVNNDNNHGSSTPEKPPQEQEINQTITQGPTPSSQFNIPHLRLLLNWATSTCHSIARAHADAKVWQDVIPQQALTCPYLLHGIFAVSALHMALSSPSTSNPRNNSNCIGSEQHQQREKQTML